MRNKQQRTPSTEYTVVRNGDRDWLVEDTPCEGIEAAVTASERRDQLLHYWKSNALIGSRREALMNLPIGVSITFSI